MTLQAVHAGVVRGLSPAKSFCAIDDSPAPLHPRADANWLIFREARTADLFSRSTLSLSQETFLSKVSRPSEVVPRWLVKWSTRVHILTRPSAK